MNQNSFCYDFLTEGGSIKTSMEEGNFTVCQLKIRNLYMHIYNTARR